MELDTIKSKAQQLILLYKQTDSYRQEWQDTTKPRLIEVLTSIQNEVKIGWLVQTVSQITNLENINIQFGAQKSGITKNDNINQSYRHFVKQGASLLFGQTANGEIAVVVTYPFIEEWVTQKPAEVIDRVPPHSITEDFIRLQVEKFLDEMIKWENSDASHSKIGFSL
ncbi:hypothetical protein [Spirosoma jeollabukense]